MTRAIIGFKAQVTDIQCCFKLAQDECLSLNQCRLAVNTGHAPGFRFVRLDGEGEPGTLV